MNFDFEINSLLPFEITTFSSDLKILNLANLSNEEFNFQLNRESKQKVGYLIDKIGESSSKAQSLKEIITSYRKLSLNDQHRVYLMKDPDGNIGKGSLVGLLKVGKKHLFIYDSKGQNHEMNSLCVLDFYVCDNQQRKGYGRRLFDFMLQMENIRPEHLAIDSPSEKSIRFLRRHYDLKNPIYQVNNFVVYSGFFENSSNIPRRNINRKFDVYSANPYLSKSDLPPLSDIKAIQRTGSVDSKFNNRPDYSTFNVKNNSFTSLNQNQNVNLFTNVIPIPNSSRNIFDSPSTNSNLFNSNSANVQANIKTHFVANTIQKSSDDSFKSESFLKNNSLLLKSNSMNENLNQTKVNSYYETHFNQANKYSAFPSLNPLFNKANSSTLNSKPPLPSQPNSLQKNQDRNFTNQNPYNNNNNNINSNTSNVINQINRRTNINPNDPFPSLASTKNSDLYSNQSYMSSKFSRTRLW